MKRWLRSLPVQVALAAGAGVVLGVLFPGGTLKPGAELGKIVIHWVKIVAGPFLFLTILAAIAEAQVGWRQGIRLLAIALANTAVAIGIGMGATYLFLRNVHLPQVAHALPPATPPATVSFSGWLHSFMPPSLLDPFVRNDVLLIALLGLLCGIAARRAYGAPEAEGGGGEAALAAFARKVERVREIPAVLLRWLLHVIPIAVLGVVAGAVSEHGAGVLVDLGRFVAAALAGLSAQVVLVYVGVWILLVAKIPLRTFVAAAREPLIYALGVNSSLATLPLTLKALKRLGISDRSASLGAGVATNLNNDGIVLYEAQAAFFIALLAGVPLGPAAMLSIALTCIVAAMGITGVPEAGFISLSVVVSTLGYPADYLPLLLAVDWVLARARSGVNVISDMTLSIALDATEPKASRAPA